VAKTRTITLEIEGLVNDETYADLAHAVWSVAQAALRDRNFTLVHDGHISSKQLNDRWAEVSRSIWQKLS
jgi:hypothetical protein